MTYTVPNGDVPGREIGEEEKEQIKPEKRETDHIVVNCLLLNRSYNIIKSLKPFVEI
jgi:hypothetical protein